MIGTAQNNDLIHYQTILIQNNDNKIHKKKGESKSPFLEL